jgi:hypothetical protein
MITNGILVRTHMCVTLFFRHYYSILFIKLKCYVYDDVRFLYLIILASISWQQSQMNWLRKGDANSKKKHDIMSSHRRANVISTILVDGTIVEGVDELSSAIFFHFGTHFKAKIYLSSLPVYFFSSSRLSQVSSLL